MNDVDLSVKWIDEMKDRVELKGRELPRGVRIFELLYLVNVRTSHTNVIHEFVTRCTREARPESNPRRRLAK